MCPLFRELRNAADLVKITGREHTKSHAIFSFLFSSANKNAKLKGAKIIHRPNLSKLRAATITG